MMIDMKALLYGGMDGATIRALLTQQGIAGLQQMAGYQPRQMPADMAACHAATEAYIEAVTPSNNHILAASFYCHDLVRELLLRGDYIALRSFDGW